jgi:hypothetical protein
MDWLRRLISKPEPTNESPTTPDDEARTRFLETVNVGRDNIDHLCLAAELGDKAQEAVKSRRFDQAWGLLNDQQKHYLQHARKYGFTARQTLAIDGSLHVPMANIRRLEGAHDDALAHILYADMTDDRKTKSMEKLLRAYFNRCRFEAATLDEAVAFIQQQRPQPNYRRIQLMVAEWRGKKTP